MKDGKRIELGFNGLFEQAEKNGEQLLKTAIRLVNEAAGALDQEDYDSTLLPAAVQLAAAMQHDFVMSAFALVVQTAAHGIAQSVDTIHDTINVG